MAYMKRNSLALLGCPTCHAALTLQADSADPVEVGSLHCTACQKNYPVIQCIPHFIQTAELNGLNRRFARLYDRFAWAYQPFLAIAFAIIGITEERARREILDRLEPGGGKVLEVSIGPGGNLPFLVNRLDVGEVFGLDISLGQLRRCQSYTRRKGWAVDLFLGDAEQLPFQDESFDSLVHMGGINFFTDKKKAIEEMIRVVRPGARILIGDENERGAKGYEHTIPGFKGSFKGKRSPVTPPVDLVPPEMQEIRLFDAWKGWFYCLEFRKP
jgi:ubiquinone/menaquinone biosynthesis C-methylase UbiE